MPKKTRFNRLKNTSTFAFLHFTINAHLNITKCICPLVSIVIGWNSYVPSYFLSIISCMVIASSEEPVFQFANINSLLLSKCFGIWNLMSSSFLINTCILLTFFHVYHDWICYKVFFFHFATECSCKQILYFSYNICAHWKSDTAGSAEAKTQCNGWWYTPHWSCMWLHGMIITELSP